MKFSTCTASQPSMASRATSTVGVDRDTCRTMASLIVSLPMTMPSMRPRIVRTAASLSFDASHTTTTVDCPSAAAVDSKPESSSE